MGVKNTLVDLNDHLFAEIERLGDEDLTEDEIRAEAVRAKAISDVADKIVGNAKLILDALRLSSEGTIGEVPRLLTGDER